MLYYAIPNANCKLKTIKTLIALGVSNDTADIDNIKPLHYTIKFARQDIVKLLLRYKMLMNIAIQRKT
jgi:ankyrin repeat protein